MKKSAVLLAVLAGACWGSSGMLFRFLAGTFTQMEVVFIKMLVSALLFGMVILVKDPKMFRIKAKDIWMFLLAGLITMLFFNYCYFTAMLHTTVAVAAALLYTGPGFVVLISAFLFKEKITKQKVIALLVLFSGCACAAGVFTGEQLITLTGVFFGLLAGLCYGLYSIFTRLAMEKGYAGFTFAFYVIAISAVGALPFVDFGHFVPAFGDANLLLCFAVALMNCFLPYMLFTKALATLLPGDAAMLATSEPVIAAMLSVFVLGEAITASVILGICLIVIGILIVNGGVKKKTE